ncbi:hypothetical protein F9288_10805 [Sphingomonas sp. CL5.1]|uniref:hypothetical protein n=1 Tax=Sphingomonas sp. CL5.1 TaxID=2653203 RepID=UPI0015838FD1|nr:hypothetical protein [Sphingomonas sp. CL5.1]QKS00062.1 hypothetical protein F9288_10805 [Sphingomonas sp. CL5.1]
MNPGVAAVCGLGVTAFYVTIVRDQIKDGAIPIPLTGPVRPIIVRRDQHPLLYWVSVTGQIALMLLIVIGSLAAIIRSFIA